MRGSGQSPEVLLLILGVALLADFTDFELVGKCLRCGKAEADAAFAELVGRYKNLVYSIVLRMINDREEANDLAQDVFVKIYKNLDKYYPDFKFSTWVMRITTNHVIDYRRKKKADYVPLEDAGFDPVAESLDERPEDALMEKERAIALARALDGLPDMYKAPIVLYHKQGLSYQEIADVIDEPLTKVKNRIFRGRKMLKDSLMGAQGGLFCGT